MENVVMPLLFAGTLCFINNNKANCKIQMIV